MKPHNLCCATYQITMDHYDENCSRCGGLIMRPGKVYGFAGVVCYCTDRPSQEAKQPYLFPNNSDHEIEKGCYVQFHRHGNEVTVSVRVKGTGAVKLQWIVTLQKVMGELAEDYAERSTSANAA